MEKNKNLPRSYTRNYSEIYAQDSSLRGKVRHLTLDLASLGNKFWTMRKPCVQLLYFHHVFDDEVAGFEELVTFIAQNYTVISHSEAIQRIATNDIDNAYVAFSSDDGFINNQVAATILERYGISACFFINPNSIGLTSYDHIKTFCSQRLSLPPIEFLQWSDVTNIQSMGHEVGSHSLNHFRLTQLNHQQLKEDLSKSKEIIESQCGPIKHFAVPYGTWNDFSQVGVGLLSDLGFVSCAAAIRGCHKPLINEPSEKIVTVLRDLFLGGWPRQHTEFFMKSNHFRKPIPRKGLWM